MKNRTVLWLFAAFVLGFGMPFLGCGGLIIASGIALGQLGGGLSPRPISSGGSGPGVAVIRVDGAILSGGAGPFSSGIAASEDLVAQIHQARDDRDAKAILLRVNSPGGSVVASDVIYHALVESGKPIVVYMDETAASGGYYVSMSAEWIVANPNTLTGSIGVISEFPTAEELLDNWGIEIVTIKSGPVKDSGSMFRDMTDEERARWQALIDEVYAGFVQVVADGRNMDEAEVRAVADGSVYTGRQALELGLIDALGYEEDAIAKAAELGGIDGTPRLINYQRPATFYDLLQTSMSARSQLPTPQDVSNWLGWPSLLFQTR